MLMKIRFIKKGHLVKSKGLTKFGSPIVLTFFKGYEGNPLSGKYWCVYVLNKRLKRWQNVIRTTSKEKAYNIFNKIKTEGYR